MGIKNNKKRGIKDERKNKEGRRRKIKIRNWLRRTE